MITGLILKNYSPLYKKGVKYIELDTKEIFNIILGRNGFGKTSLLQELSPLPPDNGSYEQGGYKEVRIVNENGTYILKSSTGKSSQHEFIHNGKNLNEGNTLLVQKELVKIHFKLTNNIKNILSGLDVRDLFTTLSTARRKDFLMSINPNDTSYALKIFEKLKSNLSTIKGGLKTQRQRLVSEESRAKQLASLSPEELQKEISLMDNQIKNALLIHGMFSNVEFEQYGDLKNQIGDIISRLMSNDVRIKFPKSIYQEQLDFRYKELDRSEKMNLKLTTVLAEVTTQLQGLDSSTQSLDGYKSRLEMIETSLELFTQEIDNVQSYFVTHELFSDNRLYENDVVYRYCNELIDQLQQVSRARDLDITSQAFAKAQQDLVHATNEKSNIDREISSINHSIDHFNKAESVECPDCNSKFKLGFEKFNVKELEVKRNDLVRVKENLVERIQKLSDYIEANEDWYSSMQGFHRFLRRLESSEVIYQIVDYYQVGKKDLTSLIELLRRTIRYNELVKQIDLLEKEQVQVKAQINFLESSDINALFQRAEDVERELAITQRSIGRLKVEIKEHLELIDIINGDEQLRDQLHILVEELKEKVENNGKYKVKQKVEQLISDLTPRKDQLISNLIRAESLNSVIQSIADNIKELEKREKHTLLLMDGLSPVKGLIGYLMNDFLVAVIANMNAVIQPIWSNRLQILNCSTSKSDDDVDLSYIFPAVTGDNNTPIKDVGDCSGGEREMVNLAFRWVILQYLGKNCGMPLIMDEVGVALDELHRGRFCSWVAEQYRLDKINQSFLVSHYVNQFGMFTNANVIALNIEGLNIPVKVNSKAIIK